MGAYTLIELADGERQLVLDPSAYAGCTVIAEAVDAIDDAAADLVDGAWTVPLAVLQERAWERVKAIRDAQVNAPTPFGVAQCDIASAVKINGIATMATIAKSAGAAFSEVFTMADNSEVTLDADQAIAFGVAVGDYISAVYSRGRDLRVAINGAATAEALAAIDLESGWPS